MATTEAQATAAQPQNERDTSRMLGASHQSSTSSSSVNRPPVNPRPNTFALRCALAASVTSVILGFEIGVLSETIVTTKRDQDINGEYVEIIMLMLHFISLIGSIVAGRTSDRKGRRFMIVIVGLFFFTAAFIMGFASSDFFILLGRSVAQVGVGYTLMIAPIYMAEVSPAVFRGLFTSLPEVFINVGIVLGYLCNYFFSKIKFNGRHLMLCQGAISLVMLAIAVHVMPESPRWLVMQGRLHDARDVLVRISKSEEEALHQLSEIKEAAGIPEDRNEDVVNVQGTEMDIWRDLLRHPTPSIYHGLVLACLIQFFHQASGIDSVLLNISHILDKAGITLSNKILFWTVGVELVKTIFIIVASLFLDKLGRRRLLLISIGGMMVSLFSLGICLTNDDGSDNGSDKKQMWVIGSLFGYVASFSVGMGPITSVYTTEIFPLRLRAQGCAIAFAVNQGTSALIASAFLLLHEVITLGGVAFSFAVVACVAWSVFFVIMPETKRRTLEEMGQFFGELTQWRSVARDIRMRRSRARQIEMGRQMGRRRTMGRRN